MKVWLNGEFVDRDAASVSVFDAGFQHAVGLFETMCARNGQLFRPGVHMGRLAESARLLRLSERLKVRPLGEAAQHVVDESGMADARVRMTVTGGNLNALQTEGASPLDPTVLIVAQPPTPYPAEFFERGVTVRIADGRANPLDPFAGHKTLSYWSRIQALQIAAAAGAGEALWFTVSNHLASGSVSNILLVSDGMVRTPYARGEEVPGALPSPVLPGVTRSAILELAADENLAIERCMLDINDVLSADEVLLTNSSWGVLPVVRVEQQQIADGMVGDVTRRLREAWLALVDEETSA